MLKAQNASLRASDDASQLEGRSSSDIYDLKLTESELYILVSAVNDSLSRPVSSGGIWLKKGVDEAAALLRRLSIVAFGYPDEPVPWTAVQRVEWVHALDASNAALRAMGVDEGLPSVDEAPL